MKKVQTPIQSCERTIVRTVVIRGVATMIVFVPGESFPVAVVGRHIGHLGAKVVFIIGCGIIINRPQATRQAVAFKGRVDLPAAATFCR